MKPLVRRFAPLGAAFCLAILLLPAAAWSAEKIHGWGIVMSRNLTESTLEIDGRVYQVTPSTSFTALDGSVLELATLPIFDVSKGLFSVADATKVEYWGQRDSTGAVVLDAVQIVNRLPE